MDNGKDKSYLDQLVEYPALAIRKICEDSTCVGLIVNKSPDDVTYEDQDRVLDKNLFDYQDVDNTVQTTEAFIWAEIDIPDVQNRTVKNCELYITVSCHKNYMKLDPSSFPGFMGNRRDNLVRYIDKLLNNACGFGIGTLKLKSIKTLTNNNGFTAREMTYEVPDFNITGNVE